MIKEFLLGSIKLQNKFSAKNVYAVSEMIKEDYTPEMIVQAISGDDFKLYRINGNHAVSI